LDDGPAQKAGLQATDVIAAVDEQHFTTIEAAQQYIVSHKGQTFVFQVKRGDKTLNIPVASLGNPPADSGPTGIALSMLVRLQLPWYSAIWEAANTTWSELQFIVIGIYHVFASGKGLKSLGGPVKIAQLTGQVADMGFAYLLQFTAFLSLNLAILNTLPFPALDGGRVLFLLIEKIRRKRNNQTVEQVANTAGFALLLLLMVVITVRDVRNLGGIGRILHKLIGG
jgi:regulator of sigma E protease